MELMLNNNQVNTQQDYGALLSKISKGIDDMEAGRELPLEEANEAISELRDIRRNARI